MTVFLDTNIVIYAIESHAGFGTKAQARIASTLSSGDQIMVSDLVRMECLVEPIRTGNSLLERQYLAFFARSDVGVVSITAAVCDRAARIRATHRYKPMDSLQLAAAVEHGAGVFLTADARLNAFPDLVVEILS
jgi:predicted nucleic acid-binding protein